MITKKFTIVILLAATTCFALIGNSVAALSRAVNDEEGRPGRRPANRVVLSGQVLLVNSGVSTLEGSPPSPPIVPFSASLRIYLSQGNTFVATVKSDAGGRFAISLPPGRYRVVPDLMRGQQTLAPGDANIIIAGPYEGAPALEVSLVPKSSPNVTITYRRSMGG